MLAQNVLNGPLSDNYSNLRTKLTSTSSRLGCKCCCTQTEANELAGQQMGFKNVAFYGTVSK